MTSNEKKESETKESEFGVLDAKSESSGGWFSWYNDAKSKTISTLSMVKRDLTELGETVGQQAVATIEAVSQAPYVGQVGQTAHEIGTKAGSWVKSIASSVNDVVLQMTDTTMDEELNQVPIIVGANDPKNPRRSASFASAKVVALQSDPSTFLNEPSGAPELFEDWLDHFSLADKKGEIIDLLAQNEITKRLYSELVPSKVSSSTFWERYFYKVHQFELDQARIESFIQRAGSDSVLPHAAADSPEDSWGDDSDLDEITAAMKDKGLYDQVAVADVIDEQCALAVLALEDRRRQSACNNNDVTSSAVLLDGTCGANVAGADEVCSENSFCVVNSGYSSDNGENGFADVTPN